MTHESPRQQRARLQAERRAAATGIGPTEPDAPVPAFPGAKRWFALFGEVMLVGILTSALSLAVVTVPLALAVNARHLRAYLKGEDSGVRAYLADLRAGLGGGLLVGLAMVVVCAAAIFSILIAADDLTGLGPVMVFVGWFVIAATATILLMLAGDWNPETGWRGAIKRIGDQFEADPAATVYLLVTACFVGLAGWQFGPLVVPAAGLAVFIAVAIPHRPRRGDRPAR